MHKISKERKKILIFTFLNTASNRDLRTFLEWFPCLVSNLCLPAQTCLSNKILEILDFTKKTNFMFEMYNEPNAFPLNRDCR